jgi:hypothetical protein
MTGAGVLRREALAMLGALAAAGCGGSPAALPGRSPDPGAASLKLDPVVDLVAAAGLRWLVDARPRELLASPVLGPAVAAIIPGYRFDAFAEHHGGIDVRAAEQLAIAVYAQATLVLALAAFDAGRVEAAFAARVIGVEGRAVEGGVTRMWGSGPGGREQVALLSREAVGFERGQSGPLRAAVYFAQGRLRRSLPALRAEPLVSAASLAGDAPLRAFAPGPFEGPWANGVAGLLGATTAVAAALRPVSHPPNGAIAVQLLLMGGWGDDAPAAAERLRSAIGVLARDPLSRVMGVDHPIDGPTVSADTGALRVDVMLDAVAVARGVHIATDASLAEIMTY